MKAIVIGAGIGGLTAALALRKAGIEIEIYERVGELRAVGAGISLWANAIRALAALGLGDPLRARSVEYVRTAILRADGAAIAETSLEELVEHTVGGEAIPAAVMVHRADLSNILAGPVCDAIRLGRECTGFEIRGERVAARFHDGSEAVADLLVAADGIHSAIRAQLHPNEPLRYSGYTAWRSVVKFDTTGLGITETWGFGRRFGIVPMSGGLVYWFATRNAPEGQSDPASEIKHNLLDLFQGWHAPIRMLIEASDDQAILRNDIVDRAPLRAWGTGPVTLLGDAAHPMTPNLGQGGCQAIEDGLVLARALAKRSDVPAALRSYESERIARTSPIVSRSREAGVVAQFENPLACRVRDFLFAKIPRSVLFRQLAATAGYRGHLG